jgi:hypothetical protein
MANAKKTDTTPPVAVDATPTIKTNTGFAARTRGTFKKKPSNGVLIATGAVAALATSLFFLRRSDKSLGEFTNDLTSRAKDGLTDLRSKAKDSVTWRRDGVDQEKSQSEIAEEALTLKMTGGAKPSAPIDPLVEDQTQVGSIAY